MASPAKPELLYISPVIPALTGNGLAMRAGLVLEALAAHYTISLLVVRLYGSRGERLCRELKALCRRVAVVQPPAPAAGPRWRSLAGSVSRLFVRADRADSLRGLGFDVVHVFRVSMLPFARPFYREGATLPRRHLDLDDIDSTTQRHIAALCRRNGDDGRAAVEESQARRSEILEDEALREFHRVYVCSEEDRAALARRAGPEILVLPNGVRPPAPASRGNPSGPFRFLLIGTLGYYPNEDAVLYLCREIIPRLRQRAAAFEVEIVGGGATDRLRDAAAAAGAHLTGRVADVDACYRRAAAVVAPVRAGGGTRIKILEAFAWHVPVVSTSAGALGIGACDEREILIGDTPEAFAGACQRLMEDAPLRERLAGNAFELMMRHFSLEAIRRTVAASLIPR